MTVYLDNVAMKCLKDYIASRNGSNSLNEPLFTQCRSHVNNNLADIKSIIGTGWLKKVTISTNIASGAHALLTVSGNVYYIYSSGGNLTIINIQNNARPDVTVTVNKLILNITSTANANMLVGIIPFSGNFTLT